MDVMPVNHSLASTYRGASVPLVVTSVLALLLLACGDVARPSGPAPTPTEPIIIASEGVPGAAGLPLGPYTPGSDVSIEVRTNESIDQLVGLLAELEFIDWDSVLENFEAAPAPIGETTPPSVAEVAGSAATGPLGAAYSERFGSADWPAAASLRGDYGRWRVHRERRGGARGRAEEPVDDRAATGARAGGSRGGRTPDRGGGSRSLVRRAA